MIITWHGEGCFRIQNGDTSILIDPPREGSGTAQPRFQTDVLIKTITAWPASPEQSPKVSAVVWGAGEYDIAGITIRGFELPGESEKTFFKTVYVVGWDDVSIGLLGHCAQPLPPSATEHLEECDVLIGPSGGAPFAEVEAMVKLVKQLNPKIFIPSFLKAPGVARSGAITAQQCADHFNGGAMEETEKFVFKKKDLVDIKKTRVVCLKG
ncbi:MAG: MBL fold metallo-hydrolase [Candidatus Paceibacterota bacterium]|jgi:L-ascorbate metabolism protein UlaG (beta-lactamase superfamily)